MIDDLSSFPAAGRAALSPANARMFTELLLPQPPVINPSKLFHSNNDQQSDDESQGLIRAHRPDPQLHAPPSPSSARQNALDTFCDDVNEKCANPLNLEASQGPGRPREVNMPQAIMCLISKLLHGRKLSLLQVCNAFAVIPNSQSKPINSYALRRVAAEIGELIVKETIDAGQTTIFQAEETTWDSFSKDDDTGSLRKGLLRLCAGYEVDSETLQVRLTKLFQALDSPLSPAAEAREDERKQKNRQIKERFEKRKRNGEGPHENSVKRLNNNKSVGGRKKSALPGVSKPKKKKSAKMPAKSRATPSAVAGRSPSLASKAPPAPQGTTYPRAMRAVMPAVAPTPTPTPMPTPILPTIVQPNPEFQLAPGAPLRAPAPVDDLLSSMDTIPMPSLEYTFDGMPYTPASSLNFPSPPWPEVDFLGPGM